MLYSVRVIAGIYRSRPLIAPPGLATRPTSDRLRETLFNVLGPRVAGASFADLYAGSGAVGIEALSRGARHATLVERAQPALQTIHANLTSLGIRSGVRVESVSVLAWCRRAAAGSLDLVFLDPPYDAMEEYEAVLAAAGALLAPDGLLVAEHRRKDALAESYGTLRRTRVLPQGDAALSFYALLRDDRSSDEDDPPPDGE